MHFNVLIDGAGHGGAQAAIALRQNRFEDSIAIVREEPEIPYERPPLSKEYFSGEKSFERIASARPSSGTSGRSRSSPVPASSTSTQPVMKSQRRTGGRSAMAS